MVLQANILSLYILLFPLFNTESLIFKIESIFKFKGHLKKNQDKIGN